MTLKSTPESNDQQQTLPAISSQHSQRRQVFGSNIHIKNISHEENRFYTQSQYPISPRTPRRNHSDTYQSDPNTSEYGSTRKFRNKSRPKNVITSPAPNKNLQNDFPQNYSQSAANPLKSAQTPTAAAYAGPTFHSSPAPSTLPIPSFYSKSTPDSPSFNSNGQNNATPINMNSPAAIRQISRSLSQDSQPNILIKKVRERNEKVCRTTSDTILAAHGIPPNKEIFPPFNEPPLKVIDTNAKFKFKKSANEILATELEVEGDHHISYGSSFSTPYSERIKAVRPEDKSKPKVLPQTSKTQSRPDNAEALKAYLFSGHLIPTPSVTTSYQSESKPSLQPLILNEPFNSSCNSQFEKKIIPISFCNNAYTNGSMRSNNIFRESNQKSNLQQEKFVSELLHIPSNKSLHSVSSLGSRNYTKDSSTFGTFRVKDPEANSLSRAKSYPSNTQNSVTPNIQEMEDSLRKILKLDSIRKPGNSVSNLELIPA